MNITKTEALAKIEELKNYVAEIESTKEEKVTGIQIMSRYGGVKFQSTKTTFKEAVIEGKANLCDANLCDADLCDADLRGANLCGADLCDADLRGANLCGADLRGADLCGADLCGAELASATFYGRGGTKVIMKKDLEGFLGALGFILEE
jgi:uncharacterized protein YjbI with pentapeptide repeats